MTLSEELKWRGFVNQTTLKDLKQLDKNKIKFYWGVDPSSDSMTIGNLAAAMMVKKFINYGHSAILLIGGATGMIGDPDGKLVERDLLTVDQILNNKKGISRQYARIFSGEDFKVVDNNDWFKDINYVDFLREIGKNVPVRQMLSREFVQTRLSENGKGISYAEFSYSLIQGYDFLHLFKEYGVTLQLCGADQWGNSIAGVDLIRRLTGGEAHVWSSPLIVDKTTGIKFGKTEDGAVWLDESKTSVYKFYQFWINVDDESVDEYLKIYTELDKNTIQDVMESHNESRSNRLAQKHLAYETTKLVHGKARADAVRNISEVLFGGKEYEEITSKDFKELETELKTITAKVDTDLVELLVQLGHASSKGEARHFLNSNAIYINGQQIPLIKKVLGKEDFIDGYCVVRRGKNLNALVKIK
jgi:tyrosyl-tRNA synthetase